MTNTRYFLDTRRVKDGSPLPLKVAISHHVQTAYIPLDLRIHSNQWDNDKAVVINHLDEKFLNVRNQGIKFLIDKKLLWLADTGKLASLTASQVKSFIEEELHPEKAEQKKQILTSYQQKMQHINLQYLRKSHGLTQRQLAERTGYSQGFISQIENGKAPAPAAFVAKLQDVFRMSDAEIYSRYPIGEQEQQDVDGPQADVREIVRRFINMVERRDEKIEKLEAEIERLNGILHSLKP